MVCSRFLRCLLLAGLFGLAPESPTVIRHTTDGLEKRRPVWSPDGAEILFARHEPDGRHVWLYRLDPESPSSPVRLTDREPPEYDGVFSPDGASVLFVAISQVGTQGNLDLASISVDRSGFSTVVGDFEGKLSHQDWPSWSPDGTRFAFSSTHEGNQEIYSAAADGSDLVRLSRNPGIDSHPCWTPDGTRVVFTTDRWGGLEIASVSRDGTDPQRLTESPGLDDYAAVAPDGSRIAFVSLREGQYDIFLMNLDGSDPVNLTRHPARDLYPTWTSDGRGVTFASDRDGGTDLYTILLDQ